MSSSEGRKRKHDDVQDGVPEALMLARHQQGQCTRCELQCFDVGEGGRMIPVTIEGLVMRGRCLLCRPLPRQNAPVAVDLQQDASQEHASEARSQNMSVRSAESHPAPQNEGERTGVAVVIPPSPPKIKTGNDSSVPQDGTERRQREPSAQVDIAVDCASGSNKASDSDRTLFISDGSGTVYEGKLTEGTLNKGKGRFAHVHKHGEYKGKSDVYEGMIQKGCFEGQGKFYVADGGVYRGSFERGQYNGYGVMELAGGDVYRGEWEDDLMSGQGEYRYFDGGIYVGEFKNWNRCGKGKMVWPNRDIYEGEWKDDKREGQGKTTTGSSCYTGQYKNDREHGKGFLEVENGDTYDGMFAHGSEHGRGIMKKNGDVYEGEFSGGELDGRVSITYKCGTKYDGEYRKNQREGQGTLVEWRNGKSNGSYQGSWKKDKRDGHGVAVDGDGDMYSGMWKANRKHGDGVLRYRKSGVVKAGRWKEDKYVGKSKLACNPRLPQS